MKSKYPRSVLIIATIGGILLIMLFATRPKWLSPNVGVAKQNILHSTQDTPIPQTPAQANAPDTRAAPTGPLDVEYASPAPQIAPPLPEATAAQVQAVVTRDKKSYSPKFYSGRSERMAVGLNQTVPIQLSWPGDNEHAGVFIQAVHGGKIDGKSNNKTVTFGPDKSASFTFTPDAGEGTYEIVLRRGTTEEALSFWVPTGNPTDPPTIPIK
jgi:hypothetical protein